MKYFLGLAAVICALAASMTHAAQLSVTPYPNNVYAIFLDGESTVFNGISFMATPNGGAVFENPPSLPHGPPRPPGMAFTYRNGYLDLDPTDPDIPGGKGWTLLGRVNTAQKLAFAGGPLGQTISTATEPNGDLFLANLRLSSSNAGATVQVQLVNGTDTVFAQTLLIFGVPEPSTFGLTLIGVLGPVTAIRRRKLISSGRR